MDRLIPCLALTYAEKNDLFLSHSRRFLQAVMDDGLLRSSLSAWRFIALIASIDTLRVG
jgi:hypothetical protein